MASNTTGRWLAKLGKENLPMVVALQGLGFFLLAFFIGAPATRQDMEGRALGTGPLTDDPPVEVADSQIPADLLPERLRLPRFPDPKERNLERQPVPAGEKKKVSRRATSFMDSLRVDTVALEAPAVVELALALPDAPDELTPGGISRRTFGEGRGRPGLMGPGEGNGGFGELIGDMGRGDGPSCHPRRPRAPRRPGAPWGPGPYRNPRNPITERPGIYELPPSYRYRDVSTSTSHTRTGGLFSGAPAGLLR